MRTTSDARVGLLFAAMMSAMMSAVMLGCGPVVADQAASAVQDESKGKDNMEIATFGGGCFWCVEAVFERLKGVSKVVSGYEGGHVENPTYEQVCAKRTGHIEVCQIHYDPSVISYDELLSVFFKTHDPTSRDAQGADEGPQYRSVIFFHDDDQETAAKEHIKQLNESGAYGKRQVVTEVRKTETFYEAEEYHQDYFANNPYGGYCQAVVRPKVEKVEREFSDKLKESAK